MRKRFELNELMSFGHVVYSDGSGNVSDDSIPEEIKLHAPESVYLDLDSDGQSLDDDYHGVSTDWTPLQGFTGQDRYDGPTMHTSEFIGGRIEDYIRENVGYYVAVAVDCFPDNGEDSEAMGWAVFHREASE
jgi:hypothetical protein